MWTDGQGCDVVRPFVGHVLGVHAVVFTVGSFTLSGVPHTGVLLHVSFMGTSNIAMLYTCYM